MLEKHEIPHRYRDYRKEPLSEAEIRDVLASLGSSPRDLLRRRDRAAAELTGEESDAELIAAMAKHPTLLQRPIGVLGNRAAVGRPPESLLDLLEA